MMDESSTIGTGASADDAIGVGAVAIDADGSDDPMAHVKIMVNDIMVSHHSWVAATLEATKCDLEALAPQLEELKQQHDAKTSLLGGAASSSSSRSKKGKNKGGDQRLQRKKKDLLAKLEAKQKEASELEENDDTAVESVFMYRHAMKRGRRWK
jgi:hypothetical protein